MRDTYIDRGLRIFLRQMLKAVSISFINSELARKLYSVGLLSNLNNNTLLLLYACEVIHWIKKGATSQKFQG